MDPITGDWNVQDFFASPKGHVVIKGALLASYLPLNVSELDILTELPFSLVLKEGEGGWGDPKDGK